MTRAVLLLAALLAAPAVAEQMAAADVTVVATRPIRAKSLVTAADVAAELGATPGALSHVEQAIGREARVTIYQGRALTAADLGPPALVERNQPVSMIYSNGALTIAAEGRALGRAGKGERVRVMNLDSRATVTGVVAGPGLIEVR